LWFAGPSFLSRHASKDEAEFLSHCTSKSHESKKENMTTSLESSTSSASKPVPDTPSRWLKLGLIAAASAFAGGLAAAWWYRQTLAKLRQSEETAQNPDFRISGDDPPDEA